jgi:hypothetical protein
VPYRGWRENWDAEIEKILSSLKKTEDEEPAPPEEKQPPVATEASPQQTGQTIELSGNENALFQILKTGVTDSESALHSACRGIGRERLGQRIRAALQASAQSLHARGIISVEGDEMKNVQVSVRRSPTYGSARRWRRWRPRRGY